MSAKPRNDRKHPTATTRLAKLGRITFDPVLTDAQVIDLETAHAEFNRTRHFALITLTRTQAQLVAGFRDDPDTLLEMIAHAGHFQQHCRSVAGLADAAVSRLLVVAAATIGVSA